MTFNFLDLGYGSAIANVIFAITFVLASFYRLAAVAAPGGAAR